MVDSNSENFVVGKNFVRGNNVVIGNGCVIGNNVVVHDDSIIGDNVRIDDNVVIGKKPMKAVTSAITIDVVLEPTSIGNKSLIGTNVIIYRGAKIGFDCLVADLATIRENVSVGDKTIVGRNVAIENNCSIGNLCKLETNSYITAHSTLKDNVFISPGVLTSNDNYAGRSEKRFSEFKGVTIEKGGRVGVGAIILPGKIIEEDSLVGAGALLTKNTVPKKIFLGSPAKEFRDVPVDQLLENQK